MYEVQSSHQLLQISRCSRHTVHPTHSTSCVGTESRGSSQLGQCTVRYGTNLAHW